MMLDAKRAIVFGLGCKDIHVLKPWENRDLPNVTYIEVDFAYIGDIDVEEFLVDALLNDSSGQFKELIEFWGHLVRVGHKNKNKDVAILRDAVLSNPKFLSAKLNTGRFFEDPAMEVRFYDLLIEAGRISS